MFDIIEQSGLTQGEFGALVGVSRITVSNWVHGKAKPSRYLTDKVSRHLTLLTAAHKLGRLPGNLPSLGRSRAMSREQYFKSVLAEVVKQAKAARADKQ